MGEGRRVLALAMEPEGGMKERDMVFLGFVSMQDPVRPEAHAAVQGFAQAGVSTVMITGDHPDTAFSIGAGSSERTELFTEAAAAQGFCQGDAGAQGSDCGRV